MKYLTGLLIILSGFILFSCIKHEVIPPPPVKVELPASFKGTLEGASYEIIKDVNGYYCESTQAKEILPTHQPSKITYYSSIKSDKQLDFVQISLGKLNFNADVSITPSVEDFKMFFNNNVNPSFKSGAEGGVEIVYRDGQGGVWYSDEASTLPQDFTFTSLVQESDEKGDYMIFTAKFNVSLVNSILSPTDTIVFENATFEGFFKR